MANHAGAAFRTRYAGRGLALGDFDNDGDSDVVFVCLNDTPVLLRNNVGQDAQWIGFQLQGTKSNRDAIGAKVTLSQGSRKLVRWVTAGASFLASHDRRLVFGLGKGIVPDSLSVQIQWPDGTRQTLSDAKPHRYQKIVQPTISSGP